MAWRDALASFFGLTENKSALPGQPGWDDLLLSRMTTKSGQAVTISTSLEVTAWLCGARVIAEGLAQVPCKVIQEGEDGERRIARDHPLYRLLYRQPNAWQTSFEFREQIGLHLVLCGNAYVLKVRSTQGEILELLPFEPGAVTVTRHADMSITYRVRLVDGQEFQVSPADMWHIRGPSWSGWMGLEAVSLARNAIGLSLAAEEFGAELFKNGARPSGFLTTEGVETLKPEQLAALSAAWQAAHVGSGQRMKTAVLSGVKWQPLSSNADEAQFIQTRKFAVTEIARALRINPIMLMEQEGSAAYASVEQMFLAHATHTLGPWFERFEQSAEINLLTIEEQNEGYCVELIDAGLVRGTAKEQAETNQIKRLNGIITANDWRKREDLPRSDDPMADKLMPAVNLYGPATPDAAPADAVQE